MLHTSHDFSRLLKSICSVTSLRPAAVRADVKVCLPFAKLKRNSLKFIKQGCDVFSAVSDGSVNDFFFFTLFSPSLCLSLAVFKNPVCKVYRFQTVDSKWMLVREQMEECTLSFSIPKQLLALYIQEDMSR